MKASDLDILLPAPVLESGVKPRWGVVTALSPLRVKLDGDDTAVPVTPAPLVAGLAVNDRVWTILVGRQVVVAGAYGGKPIPRPDSVTRVALSSNFDTGLAVWTVIPWQTEVFDDGNAWTAAAPTIITTPAGFTRVNLTLYTAWTASTTQPGRFTQIRKGANTLVVSNRTQMFESGGHITTGWTPTAAGDTFSALANSHGSGADLLGPATWGGPAWLEAVFR